jgi:hypothetical protein
LVVGRSLKLSSDTLVKPLEMLPGLEMSELRLGGISGGSEDDSFLGPQPSAEMLGLELALAPDLSVSGCSVVADVVGPVDPLLKQSTGLDSSGGVLLYMDLELFSEDPPLLCCPANKSRGKVGAQSSDWVLQLVKVFSHLVGLSCDGYEGKLSALFEDIIASNSGKVSGSSPRAGKKGMRELNNLFSSIN